MPALPAPQPAGAKRPGRPVLAAPRDCVAYTRLTTCEYEALLSLVPARGSLSDLVRQTCYQRRCLRGCERMNEPPASRLPSNFRQQ